MNVSEFCDRELDRLARELKELLEARQKKIVFAESCTCGLLAATLGRVPGVSAVLCGSAVTYRNETKASGLGVDMALLNDPDIGPVSEIVARQMIRGALQWSPEADWAVSVTGHLGPQAPAGLDGVVYAGMCEREVFWEQATVQRYDLPSAYSGLPDDTTLRSARQQDVIARIFRDVIALLS